MQASNGYTQNSTSAIPAEIKGWNWGAFLLSWIWAIGNGVWVGLLALIPGIGLIVAIYLGIQGNELAWQKRQWKSPAQFKATQKVWTTWGVAILVVGIALWILSVTMGLSHSSAIQPSVIPGSRSANVSPSAAAGSSQGVPVYPGATPGNGQGSYSTTDTYTNVVNFYNAQLATIGNGSGNIPSDRSGKTLPSGTATFTYQINGKDATVKIESQTGTPTNITITQ